MKKNGKEQIAGYSLVEIMVAMGLMAMLMSGFVGFSSFISSSDRSVRQKGQMRDLSAQVRVLMNNVQTCTANLKGYQLQAIGQAVPVVNGLNYPNGSSFIQSGHPFRASDGQNGIQVSAINVTPKAKLGTLPDYTIGPGAPGYPGVGQNFYVVGLSVQALRTGAALSGATATSGQIAGGTAALSISVPVGVLTAQDGTIQSCYADSVAVNSIVIKDEFCQVLTNGAESYVESSPPGNGGCASVPFYGAMGSPNVAAANSTNASCPPDKILDYCSADAAGTLNGVTRTYNAPAGFPLGAGVITPANPQPVGSGIPTGLRSCSCYWAAGYIGNCAAYCDGFNVSRVPIQ